MSNFTGHEQHIFANRLLCQAFPPMRQWHLLKKFVAIHLLMSLQVQIRARQMCRRAFVPKWHRIEEDPGHVGGDFVVRPIGIRPAPVVPDRRFAKCHAGHDECEARLWVAGLGIWSALTALMGDEGVLTACSDTVP